MKWTIIHLSPFVALWRSERLDDEDLRELEITLMRSPDGAPVVRGTGGLRKIRFAPPSRGKGKRGAMRVGYAQFPELSVILLITMFSKNAEANLSQAARNEIKTFLDRYSRAARKDR